MHITIATTHQHTSTILSKLELLVLVLSTFSLLVTYEP